MSQTAHSAIRYFKTTSEAVVLGSKWRQVRAILMLIAMLPTELTASQVTEKNAPFIAFKIHGEMSVEQFKDFEQNVKLHLSVDVVMNDVFARYRIVLIRGTTSPDIKPRINRVLRDANPTAKLILIPAQRNGSEIKIPTGELVVQFKSDVGESREAEILSGFDFRIIEYPHKGTADRYRVCDKDDDFSRLLQSSETLAKNDSVRYVEPDTLELAKSPAESPFQSRN